MNQKHPRGGFSRLIGKRSHGRLPTSEELPEEVAGACGAESGTSPTRKERRGLSSRTTQEAARDREGFTCGDMSAAPVSRMT